MNETPQIVATTYATNTTAIDPTSWSQQPDNFRRVQLGDRINTGKEVFEDLKQKAAKAVQSLENETMKRLVRVLIVDPDEQVPVNKSVLHDSGEILTELDDQELYFEVDIKAALDKHNEYRATVVDKSVKDRTENLEPVRIRDLRMMVVTIAEF